MVPGWANIAIANIYKVTYGLSICIFAFHIGRSKGQVEVMYNFTVDMTQTVANKAKIDIASIVSCMWTFYYWIKI